MDKAQVGPKWVYCIYWAEKGPVTLLFYFNNQVNIIKKNCLQDICF